MSPVIAELSRTIIKRRKRRLYSEGAYNGMYAVYR